jgi:hypothetical protein
VLAHALIGKCAQLLSRLSIDVVAHHLQLRLPQNSHHRPSFRPLVAFFVSKNALSAGSNAVPARLGPADRWGGWGTDDSWERIPDRARIAFAWLVTVAAGTAIYFF